MVHIIIVSHSKKLATAVVEFALEMKDDSPFTVRAVSGIESDESAMGSDPIKILESINELFDGDGILLLGDIGSSIMNIEMAIEMLPEDMQNKVKLVDAPLVEGALAAVSFNSNGVSLEQLILETESSRNIPKF